LLFSHLTKNPHNAEATIEEQEKWYWQYFLSAEFTFVGRPGLIIKVTQETDPIRYEHETGWQWLVSGF